MAFKLAFISMLVLEGVSLLAFVYPLLALPLLLLVFAAVFILAYRSLDTGIYLLFGELFFGSRGHLLEYKFLSLRLVVFTAVLAAWGLQILNSKSEIQNKLKILNPKFKTLYFLTLVAIGWGIINGYLNGNSLSDVFYDANGYLYLLALPVVLSVIRSREQLETIFQILTAAIAIIALKTLVLFFWFTFDLPAVATMYAWVIDQDIGEITGTVGSASRIFMQSQFWALMGIFIFSPLILKKHWSVVAAAILTVIMSLSRSFWLGGAAGAVFLVAMLLFYFRESWMPVFRTSAMLVLIAISAAGFLGAIGAVAGVSDTVASRGLKPSQEAAGGARLLLLPELLAEIAEAPVLGKGFGELVSYQSYLPDRVRPDNPDGTITSYAFEWGYLDTILKIGALGFLIYLFFIANIFHSGWKKLSISDNRLGLLSGLVALLVLNVTTPYLNHPLGIGMLILTAASFNATSSG